jgi:hypothetical protein
LREKTIKRITIKNWKNGEKRMTDDQFSSVRLCGTVIQAPRKLLGSRGFVFMISISDNDRGEFDSRNYFDLVSFDTIEFPLERLTVGTLVSARGKLRSQSRIKDQTFSGNTFVVLDSLYIKGTRYENR